MGTKDNIKYMAKLGVIFDEMPRKGISFEVKSEGKFRIVTPTHFVVPERMLEKMTLLVKSSGFFGRRLFKALIDAVAELDENDANDLKWGCWVKTQKPREIIRYFINYIQLLVEAQGAEFEISKAGCYKLWTAFGGYRGLKLVFKQGLYTTLDEFRRVRVLEEKMGIATPIPIENPDIFKDMTWLQVEKSVAIKNPEFNPCMTCKGCKVDSYGCRKCSYAYVPVPEEITVGVVNQIYPTTNMRNFGNLKSDYVFHNVGECKYYRSRITGKSATPVGTWEEMYDLGRLIR